MPIEVGPMAHYHMGGVRVDANMATGVRGLYAAGEAVGGANGANRLSGNAITEAFVFGQRAGCAGAEFSRSTKGSWRDAWARQSQDRIAALLERPSRDSASAAGLQIELQRLMWEQAGPFRTGAKLASALERIRQMRDHDLVNAAIGAEKVFNLDLQDWFELRAMLAAAEAVVYSALARAESRGAHQREDFPASDEAFLKNQVLEFSGGALSSRWVEPVRLHRREGIDG
jgi:succinate dehydrogenase/fumarate reductase flavoprotein subunit